MPDSAKPILLLLICAIVHGMAQGGVQVQVPRAYMQHITSLGPWPPRPGPDPGNAVSGDPRAIELGRRLFRDPRMSPVGYIACVTCHQPDRAFTDQRSRAHGLADLPRNTPALANLRQLRWFGWDGASDSLWLASIRPMLDPREFDGDPTSITRIFERDPELAACYEAVYGAAPVRDAQRTIVHVGKALAAFQETLVTGRTPFDDYRDALLRQDAVAMASYPLAALRGLQLFVGEAACVSCHSGPNFTDGRFHAVLPGTAVPLGGADAGRRGGIDKLRADPLNLMGQYNDDASKANAAATRALVARKDGQARFRTPGLRNVAVTAPYMHDGRIDRLHDTLDHGRRAGPRSSGSAPRAVLSQQQRDDLVAFLDSLTDEAGTRRPWSTEPLAACP